MPARLITFVFLGILALAVSCGRRGAEDEQVLATVGREKITVGDFRRAMARRSGDSPGVFEEYGNRKALLEEMIRSEALAQSAQEKGYYRDPEVREALKRMVVGRMEEDALAAAQAEEIGDAELEAAYRRYEADFIQPEKVRFAVILIKVSPKVSPEKRAELREKAEDIRREALDLPPATRGFGYLAAKHSEDQATRYAGGDAGWLARGRGPSRWAGNVVEAVFRLASPGELSPVVEADGGLYVLRLIEREPERRIPLEKVRNDIRMRILRERRALAVKALREESRQSVRVSVRENVLRSIATPAVPAATGEQLPPALPAD